MAQDVREIIIGPDAGLRFKIFPSDQNAEGSGLAWLKVSVWLGNTQVWSQSDEHGQDNPVEWTWVDFLSGLSRAWPWLMLESNYPIPVHLMHPGDLGKFTQSRWNNLPVAVAEQEEDALFDFKMCHDLSQFMRGIFLSPLWILLEGKKYQLWSPEINTALYRPIKEVRGVLEDFGNFLADCLANSEENRASHAKNLWNARVEATKREFLPLASGLSRMALQEISAGYCNPESFFEIDTAANDPEYWLESNELLAAARMTTGLFPLKAQRILVEYIRQSHQCETPELNRLTTIHPDASEFGVAGYEQGYGLAAWLRSELQITPMEFFDCETILKNWGVLLQDVSLPEVPGFDALAVWGPHRGPALFLNTAPMARPTTLNGRRTTIAHEICHLLCDRQGALPLVEVLGGQAPKHQERRARAFAAELLLPRSVAESKVREGRDIIGAAEYLAAHFKVSREVVWRQIINSSVKADISTDENSSLEVWART